MAKLKAISLKDHTPIEPFAHMGDHCRGICETITKYISAACDTNLNPNSDDLMLTDLQLTWAELQQIEDALQIYYGDYKQVGQMICFHLHKIQPDGTRKVDITVNLNIAIPVEEERRQVAAQINIILETFADGTTTELTLQIFDYLDNHSVYNNTAAKPSDILRSGKGSCNAFAILFRQMCLRLGIPCDMDVGYTASGSYHAWNRFLAEPGGWRYFDIPFWKATYNEKYRGGQTPIHDTAAYNFYPEDYG